MAQILRYTAAQAPFLKEPSSVAKRQSNSLNADIKTYLHLSTLVKMSISAMRGFFSRGLCCSSAGVVGRDGWKNSELRKKFLYIH